jgi:peptidoglycan hydrolase-like protein with peptidoglycan-binding domain
MNRPTRYTAPEGSPADGRVSPSEHVTWVQTTLNCTLGLRLPVDGVMNAPTRSAIRLFQERLGLAINGRLGPETESALREASRAPGPPGARPPAAESPAESAPTETAAASELEVDLYHVPSRSTRAPSYGSATAPPAPSIKVLRENIVRIAREEAARWKDGGIRQTDPQVTAVLQDYWKAGPGLSFTVAQIRSKAFQATHPWSAAFISWVMRKAGAGKAFKYSGLHSVYISAAKANRIAGNANPFKAYRLSEVAPRVGDLVCCKRAAGSKVTYDSIRAGMKTHCDIVVAVKPGAITVIGGNVDQSVKHRRTVPTDHLGRVSQPARVWPHAFAVIRIGSHEPPISGGPSPVTPLAPTPGPAPVLPKAPAPKLLKRETSPPAATLYPEINLGIVDLKERAAPMTGVFLPDGFTPGPLVDIILYLHGHKAATLRALTIDQYGNSKRFPYGALREILNVAGRNAILVAPTLGARSEAGTLLEPGGLDAYLSSVLAAVDAFGAGARTGTASSLGNLIFACHSGGGLPMRKLAGGTEKALASLRECWGFDCTYNRGDDTFWSSWARRMPSAKCYFYYIKGSQTAALSESLCAMRVANAIVEPARDARHNYVPIAHWLERIQGAAFLGALAGGGTVRSGRSV